MEFDVRDSEIENSETPDDDSPVPIFTAWTEAEVHLVQSWLQSANIEYVFRAAREVLSGQESGNVDILVKSKNTPLARQIISEKLEELSASAEGTNLGGFEMWRWRGSWS